jgi:hypothetical protein
MVVEIEPARIERAGSLRKHATPTDAEPVRLQSELAHQRYVGAPTVVVIARDVARFAIVRATGAMRETLPDARTGPVSQWAAFDLVRRGRGAPEKSFGETMRFAHEKKSSVVWSSLDAGQCHIRASA